MRNNLKAIRLKNKSTIRQVADAAGISNATAHRLEQNDGSSSPTLRIAYAISTLFGVAVYDIWPDDSEVAEEVVTVTKRSVVQKWRSKK